MNESGYADLIRNVLENGEEREDRTGTGTLSVFAPTPVKYNLKDGFPLFTGKRVPLRIVFEELAFFLRGETDTKKLEDKRVRIWTGNTSREFLDNRGLSHYPVGDMGPMYGFQWRHFGATYTTCDDDYTGKGYDQLSSIIHLLKTNRTSRRIMMTALNPAATPVSVLPPCHTFSQFYVRGDGTLDCQMYQRSADLMLGVPFNVASYSLLMCLLAHICDLKVGTFTHVMGDAHIYSNHVEGARTYLSRDQRLPPTLSFKRRHENIEDYTWDDIVLEGYDPHGTIRMQMAV